MIEDERQAFQVKVITWNRQLKGLFDYYAPSDQLKINKFNMRNNYKVYRHSLRNQNFFLASRAKLNNQNASFVCKLDLQQTNQNTIFWLRTEPNTSKQSEQNPYNTPYLVIKQSQGNTYQTQGFALKLGDKIKIGYVQYTIIELKTNYSDFQTLQQNHELIYNFKENKLETNLNSDQQVDQNTNVKRRKKHIDQNFDQVDKETTRKTLKHKKIKKQPSNNKKQTLKSKAVVSQRNSQQEQNVEKDSQNQLIEDEQTIKFCSVNQKKKPQIRVRKQCEEQKTCKICLLNQETNEDPFISACYCKGSCSLTHLSCLKSWINANTQVQDNNGVKNYLLKKSCCQICKCPFPKFIQINKNKVYLVDLELPTNSYMILQSCQPENIAKEEKKYIVIDGEKNPIVKIGRNHDSQIRIKDITVSRKHAQITFRNNLFYIKDTESKFGTLVKIQNDLKFGNQVIYVQMGRCVFKFKPILKKPALKKSSESCNV